MRVRNLLALVVAALVVAVSAGPAYAADTVAPTQPTDVVATSIGRTSLNLSWTPSTDDVGVTQYSVAMLEADYILRVATSSTNSAVVSGLRSGKSYLFAVTAYDAAGNSSPR